MLVFCNTKRVTIWLDNQMYKKRIPAVSIHGDKDQTARNEVLGRFKSGDAAIMIATQVAGRGLDMSNVKYVVNFDMPSNIEDYVHRIGRTGRAGARGISVTLLVPNDSVVARPLIDLLNQAGQVVPDKLRDMAGQGSAARWA